MGVGQDLLDVPFPQMVYRLAKAIADGQRELDKSSIEAALELFKDKNKRKVTLEIIETISGNRTSPNIALTKVEAEMTPIQMGFMPTFYQFQESIIEVKMAISMRQDTEFGLDVSGSVGWGPFSASVNAHYSQKFSYSVEGSSLLRTKLVPVPPPARLVPTITVQDLRAT